MISGMYHIHIHILGCKISFDQIIKIEKGIIHFSIRNLMLGSEETCNLNFDKLTEKYAFLLKNFFFLTPFLVFP